MPSACGALTSARCLSSVRMAERSDFSAASASWESPACEEMPAMRVMSNAVNNSFVCMVMNFILLMVAASLSTSFLPLGKFELFRLLRQAFDLPYIPATVASPRCGTGFRDATSPGSRQRWSRRDCSNRAGVGRFGYPLGEPTRIPCELLPLAIRPLRRGFEDAG